MSTKLILLVSTTTETEDFHSLGHVTGERIREGV